jgi:hypothetical protein
MKRREMLILVAGLVVGLLLGMTVIGTSSDLRTSLFGTAGSNTDKDTEYYLIDLETAQNWLMDKYPLSSDKLQASVTVLTKLPAAANFPVDFKAAEKDIKYLLPQAYAALANAKDPENLQINPDSQLSTCLGLDDNPYQGSSLYLYLAIPKDQVEKLDIPKDWQTLKNPKLNVLYWKLLACYPEPKAT